MVSNTISLSTLSEVSHNSGGIYCEPRTEIVIVLLEGEIETSYTKADNSCVVATDTGMSQSKQREVNDEKLTLFVVRSKEHLQQYVIFFIAPQALHETLMLRRSDSLRQNLSLCS